METKILKGESAKDRILEETRKEIIELKARYGKAPGIAFIGFEGVPLARYIVPMHISLAEALGFFVSIVMMPQGVTEPELQNVIQTLNNDEDIHAIVVLQPVPPHLEALRIANSIKPEKEVEGFHPLNMIGTMVPDVIPARYPMCLPAALGEIFKEAGIKPEKNEKWLFLLDDEFLANSLTKMIVHTAALKVVPNDCPVTFLPRSSDCLAKHCREADYLVIVTKHPGYVQPEWLKPGVCVIDIYSNLVREVPGKKDPSKIVPIIRGGITAEAVMNIASSILPIPGGLMTTVLAILLQNAMFAFKYTMELQEGLPEE